MWARNKEENGYWISVSKSFIDTTLEHWEESITFEKSLSDHLRILNNGDEVRVDWNLLLHFFADISTAALLVDLPGIESTLTIGLHLHTRVCANKSEVESLLTWRR